MPRANMTNRACKHKVREHTRDVGLRATFSIYEAPGRDGTFDPHIAKFDVFQHAKTDRSVTLQHADASGRICQSPPGLPAHGIYLGFCWRTGRRAPASRRTSSQRSPLCQTHRRAWLCECRGRLAHGCPCQRRPRRPWAQRSGTRQRALVHTHGTSPTSRNVDQPPAHAPAGLYRTELEAWAVEPDRIGACRQPAAHSGADGAHPCSIAAPVAGLLPRESRPFEATGEAHALDDATRMPRICPRLPSPRPSTPPPC